VPASWQEPDSAYRATASGMPPTMKYRRISAMSFVNRQ
jgi:hypothetical protein